MRRITATMFLTAALAVGGMAITTAVPAAASEPMAVECPDYTDAVTRAKHALLAGNRQGAITELKRAKTALVACSLRSEAETTTTG
jgi:hypothetical protein